MMTAAARPWLPQGALLHHEVRSALQSLIGDWSARWFSNLTLQPSSLVERRGSDPTADQDWLPLPGRARVACSFESGRWIVEQALQAPFEAPPATPKDAQLMDAVLDRMLLDLQDSLDRTFGAATSSSASKQPVLEVAVADGTGADRLWVGVPAEDLAVWLRRKLQPAAQRAPLTPLAQTLSAEPIRIEARLGDASLTLDDLATLQPGDVVVLDHALDEPIRLTLPRGDQDIAQAQLTEINGDRALVLTELARKD